MSAIRVASKNMCSVRHRPMPSAPYFTATAASCGLSALVRTPSLRAASAQPIRVAKSPETEASTVGIASAYTLPVEPSMLIQSPSWKTTSPMVAVLASSSTRSAPQPATQQVPMPRATTAAWEVMPPRAVRMPCACAMPSISSGEVSRRTRTTFLPVLAAAVASSAVKYTMPQAAPGEAARPMAISFAFFSATASNCGCSRESSCFGSTLRMASSVVIMPSLTRSTAIFSAAAAVRLPLRVWSM